MIPQDHVEAIRAALAEQGGRHEVCVYDDADYRDWFVKEWKKTGLKLDMGESCIRFKKVEDLPLDLIAEAIRRVPAETFIANYAAFRSKHKK